MKPVRVGLLGCGVVGSQVVRLLSRRGALWLDRICGAVLLALYHQRQSAITTSILRVDLAPER